MKKGWYEKEKGRKGENKGRNANRGIWWSLEKKKNKRAEIKLWEWGKGLLRGVKRTE